MKAFTLCLTLLFSFHSLATEGIDKTGKINSILDLSGLRKQVLALDGQMREGIRSSAKDLDYDVKKALESSISESFKAKDLAENIRNAMEKNLNSDEVDSLYSHFNHPDVQKMSRLEEESADVGARNKMIDYANSLNRNPPPKERVGIIVNFDQKMGLSNQQAETAALSAGAILKAFGKGISHDEFENMKKSLLPSIQQSILVGSLYTYQSIPDDELKRYFDKCMSNRNMHKLSQISAVEVKKYLTNWSEGVGVKLKSLKKSP